MNRPGPYTPSPLEVAGLAGGPRGLIATVGRFIAPQLRGHVAPRILDHWRRDGWHVHQIGAAAYVHSPDDRIHLIFGVWDRRAASPPWAARLGSVSDGYVRRIRRCEDEQAWRRMLRDRAGRFHVRLPWWRWPTAEVYRFVPSGPSWWELETARIEDDNRRIRRRLGLVAPPTELEDRASWGDR